MTTDTFRALCAELLSALESWSPGGGGPLEGQEAEKEARLLARARAALADEPAAPAPPAALPEGYIDPEHSGVDRAMLETYYAACQAEGGTADDITLRGLRAVLARWGTPAPAPPADGEVAALVCFLEAGGSCPAGAKLTRDQCRRVAELLRRQALVPVSVSERPWEREGWCDAEGRCWWGRGESDDWSTDWTLATPEAIAEFCEFSPQTVCLPAHALPLPEVGE